MELVTSMSTSWRSSSNSIRPRYPMRYEGGREVMRQGIK